jgi:hypothetical protein
MAKANRTAAMNGESVGIASIHAPFADGLDRRV